MEIFFEKNREKDTLHPKDVEKNSGHIAQIRTQTKKPNQRLSLLPQIGDYRFKKPVFLMTYM